MGQSKRVLQAILLVAVLGVCAAAQAQDFKQLLKNQAGQATQGSSQGGALGGALGGLSLPAVSGNTAGNAAGVLQYCVQRKYLSADAVGDVKDKLLSKYGLGNEEKASESADYKRGLSGLLQGDGGKSFNLDSISGKVKDKACDYVLDNATKLI
jgi:hypothetical protein